jgi:hypothetical protein
VLQSLYADQEKKGTTPYVTHFIFRPVQSLEVPGLGTATLLEALGTTQNMKGEKMLDKMSARCTALSVDSGPRKYIDGACVLADADGDKIFSTFDTRDVDKSQNRRTANVQPLRDFSGAQPLGPELLHLRLINGWLPAFSPSQVVLMHAMIDDDNGSAWHEPVVGGPGVPVPHVLAGDLRKRWLHRRW